MNTSPLYAPIQAALDAVYPDRYLTETEIGVPGVNFVFKQKIEREVGDPASITYRFFGVTSGDWVKVSLNWNCKISRGWFGYAKLFDSAIAFLEKQNPGLPAAKYRPKAQSMVSKHLQEKFPRHYRAMNESGNYLIEDKVRGIPDWKEMDTVAQALANRLHVACADVTLIVVTSEGYAPIPTRQGLYTNDIWFVHLDRLAGTLESLTKRRKKQNVETVKSAGTKPTIHEILMNLDDGPNTSIVEKGQILKDV